MDTCLYPDVRSQTLDGVRATETKPIAARVVPDLQRWIDMKTLSAWTRAEVERFVPLSLGQAFVAPNAADRFRKMLSILCLAYSTGMSRSAEIGDACRRTREFASIAGEFCPFADELRTFRRRYRAVLEVILTRLFMRAAALNAEFAREAVPRELESQFESRAKEVLNRARHLDACDDW